MNDKDQLEAKRAAAKKGRMIKELKEKATNFTVVRLPIGQHAGLLSLFRALPK